MFINFLRKILISLPRLHKSIKEEKIVSQQSLQYLTHVIELQKKAINTESSKLIQLASIMSDTTIRGNNIWFFGATHSDVVTQEMIYRAGGCAVFNGIFHPNMRLDFKPLYMTSRYEQTEGVGYLLSDSYPLKEGDFLLIHSVSGRNPAVVELALSAKEKNVYVAGLFSKQYSGSVTSRHSSGKKLDEIADIMINNHVETGDACIKIEGVDAKIAPTSSIVALTISNILLIEYVNAMLAKGVVPPIIKSGNMDKAMEYNYQLFNQYKDQIHYI
ncbi:MAG: sugar isomerase domain-containing protein [Brevinema sp.]